ncbi:TPA: hypothetical protein ACX6SR_000915 [Photobacterium damselae]
MVTIKNKILTTAIALTLSNVAFASTSDNYKLEFNYDENGSVEYIYTQIDEIGDNTNVYTLTQEEGEHGTQLKFAPAIPKSIGWIYPGQRVKTKDEAVTACQKLAVNGQEWVLPTSHELNLAIDDQDQDAFNAYNNFDLNDSSPENLLESFLWSQEGFTHIEIENGKPTHANGGPTTEVSIPTKFLCKLK